VMVQETNMGLRLDVTRFVQRYLQRPAFGGK
jgi:hypothetical protein